MRFGNLLLGALLFFSEVCLGATRLRTDEITASDDTQVSFPGGIVVPTDAVSSTTAFQSSATYSATITAETNLDSVTSPATLKYERSGNYVHVFGQVTVNPTAGSATKTSFAISLPVVPVIFYGSNRASGNCGLPTTVTNGVVNSVTYRTYVECTYGAVSTSADLVNVNFTYSISP